MPAKLRPREGAAPAWNAKPRSSRTVKCFKRPNRDVQWLCFDQQPPQRGLLGCGLPDTLLDSFYRVGRGCECSFWNRDWDISRNASSILDFFAEHLLSEQAKRCMPGCRLLGKQLFLRPPVRQPTVRDDDSGGHVRSRSRFSVPGLYACHKGYVTVLLGRTEEGKPVLESAQRILCCLRFGAPPDEYPHPHRPGKVVQQMGRFAWQALHKPCCPECVNPLHLRWGLAEENQADRVAKREAKRQFKGLDLPPKPAQQPRAPPDIECHTRVPRSGAACLRFG